MVRHLARQGLTTAVVAGVTLLKASLALSVGHRGSAFHQHTSTSSARREAGSDGADSSGLAQSGLEAFTPGRSAPNSPLADVRIPFEAKPPPNASRDAWASRPAERLVARRRAGGRGLAVLGRRGAGGVVGRGQDVQ